MLKDQFYYFGQESFLVARRISNLLMLNYSYK